MINQHQKTFDSYAQLTTEEKELVLSMIKSNTELNARKIIFDLDRQLRNPKPKEKGLFISILQNSFLVACILLFAFSLKDFLG